jgi:hypothetical protein
MKKLLLLSLVFSCSLMLNAQYQIMSNMAMGKKTIIKTRFAQGYVIKMDGTRQEGEIQLKVVDNDTTEITLKSFSGDKTTFARLDLISFGLKNTGKGDAGGSQSKAKTGDFLPGYVVLNDGNKITGQLASSKGFLTGDFTKHTWGFYVKTPGAVEPKYYGVEDNLSYLVQTDKGVETKYVPMGSYFVNFEEMMKSLNDPKGKDKEELLQMGHVVFKDAMKKEGRIARQSVSKFIFVGNDNSMDVLLAKDESISYFMQQVDGKEIKYISLMGGIQAFSGPALQWVAIKQPSGVYSYYKNPAPTHKMEQLTKLVKSEVSTSTGAGVSDEGGIYFEEWVVLNNNSGEKLIMYTKNDREIAVSLLHKCSSFDSLDDAQKKKLTHIDNIDLLVEYLNGNKCN